MNWSPSLSVLARRYERRTQNIFHRVVQLVFIAIVEGLALVGSPGQPVDTGALRGSWTVTYLSPTHAMISTGSLYAIHIEQNPRGITFRNHGPHSVALTRAGFQLIVEQATREELAHAA